MHAPVRSNYLHEVTKVGSGLSESVIVSSTGVEYTSDAGSLFRVKIE